MPTSPTWKHDCETCKYIGTYKYKHDDKMYDLYCHQHPDYASLDSLVARYGDDGPEYLATPRQLIQAWYHKDHPLYVADCISEAENSKRNKGE